MLRRKIAPIPLEIVTDRADVMALPVSAYGMLLKLVVHYWQTDCRPLPADNDRLFSIATAHRSTWVAHKSEIMRIVVECAPALEHALKARQNKLNVLAELRERGHAASRKRKLEKAIAAAAGDPAPAPRRDQAAKEAPAPSSKGFRERRVA